LVGGAAPGGSEPEPRPYDALEWDRFPWPEAVTWFARGLGAAHLGRLGDAERLAELEQAAARAGEQLFTRQVLVLRLVVSAWLAPVRGQEELALEQMQAAAERELPTPKHPVTQRPRYLTRSCWAIGTWPAAGLRSRWLRTGARSNCIPGDAIA
jgi:hypothetical protein